MHFQPFVVNFSTFCGQFFTILFELTPLSYFRNTYPSQIWPDFESNLCFLPIFCLLILAFFRVSDRKQSDTGAPQRREEQVQPRQVQQQPIQPPSQPQPPPPQQVQQMPPPSQPVQNSQRQQYRGSQNEFEIVH